MNNPSSLKALLQSMAVESMAILHGKVTSPNPLKIQIANDAKLVLGENILCLPKHLSTYKATVDISGVASGVTMTVYNALQEGDKVYILSFNHGKKYFVLDREA